MTDEEGKEKGERWRRERQVINNVKGERILLSG